MPLSAPVATLTSSLSHTTPMIRSLAVVSSPAAENASAILRTLSDSVPSGSPIWVALPSTPATTRPGLVMMPPT